MLNPGLSPGPLTFPCSRLKRVSRKIVNAGNKQSQQRLWVDHEQDPRRPVETSWVYIHTLPNCILPDVHKHDYQLEMTTDIRWKVVVMIIAPCSQ